MLRMLNSAMIYEVDDINALLDTKCTVSVIKKLPPFELANKGFIYFVPTGSEIETENQKKDANGEYIYKNSAGEEGAFTPACTVPEFDVLGYINADNIVTADAEHTMPVYDSNSVLLGFIQPEFADLVVTTEDEEHTTKIYFLARYHNEEDPSITSPIITEGRTIPVYETIPAVKPYVLGVDSSNNKCWYTSAGSGGGVDDYRSLSHLPTINGEKFLGELSDKAGIATSATGIDGGYDMIISDEAIEEMFDEIVSAPIGGGE